MGKLRSVRFYYDDNVDKYFLLSADPGIGSVTLPGPFVPGKKGDSRDCTLSRYAYHHPELFRHKVLGVQTVKDRMYVIDRDKKGGTPTHCRVYGHNGGKKVERNDKETMTKEDMTRPVTLKPVLARQHTSGTSGTPSPSNPRVRICLRGADKRAVEAGLVPEEEIVRRRDKR